MPHLALSCRATPAKPSPAAPGPALPRLALPRLPRLARPRPARPRIAAPCIAAPAKPRRPPHRGAFDAGAHRHYLQAVAFFDSAITASIAEKTSGKMSRRALNLFIAPFIVR